jgi:hypothetical protein
MNEHHIPPTNLDLFDGCFKKNAHFKNTEFYCIGTEENKWQMQLA